MYQEFTEKSIVEDEKFEYEASKEDKSPDRGDPNFLSAIEEDLQESSTTLFMLDKSSDGAFQITDSYFYDNDEMEDSIYSNVLPGTTNDGSITISPVASMKKSTISKRDKSCDDALSPKERQQIASPPRTPRLATKVKIEIAHPECVPVDEAYLANCFTKLSDY